MVLDRSDVNLDRYSDSTAILKRNAFPESESVETVEPEQGNPQKELHDDLEENLSLNDSPAVLERQSGEVVTLKQELAGQANEIETLIEAWGGSERRS